MNQLIQRHQSLLTRVDLNFERALSKKVNWNARALGIKGARGTGKSTLMFQHLKMANYGEKAIYFSLDLYFKNNSLVETVEKFYQDGGRKLFLDEVHKYFRLNI